MIRRILICLTLVAGLTLAGFDARAGTIDSILVTNDSSPNDMTPPAIFLSSSEVGPVEDVGSTSSFTHRMSFYNECSASGGVAQVHKRNVVYRLDFTVQDPGSLGYELLVESLLRGISSITQTSDGGTAFATGASFHVEIDDSTDDPDTFTTFVPLFNSTNSVSVTGVSSNTELTENVESASLGFFVGTTSFSLQFSTVPTPTTNILFGNGQSGSGFVNYGLGSVPDGFDVEQSDLGHFLTVTANFVPEPSAVILLSFGMMGVLGRRRV